MPEKQSLLLDRFLTKIGYVRQEVGDPVLEATMGFGPVAGQLLSIFAFASYPYVGRLSELVPTEFRSPAFTTAIGALLILLSVSEVAAMRRRKYCANSYTNGLEIIFQNPLLSAAAARLAGFGIMYINATNPDFYVAMLTRNSGDWESFLSFVLARCALGLVYDGGVNVLIATGRLDPFFWKIQELKQKTRVAITGLGDRVLAEVPSYPGDSWWSEP